MITVAALPSICSLTIAVTKMLRNKFLYQFTCNILFTCNMFFSALANWSIHNILLWLPNLQYNFPNSRLSFWNCLVDTLCHPEVGFNTEHYNVILQGCSESTSSVAFEVLMIYCQIHFINSFIFHCLTLNIKLFIFKLFNVKFLFSEIMSLANRRERLVYGVMDARP